MCKTSIQKTHSKKLQTKKGEQMMPIANCANCQHYKQIGFQIGNCKKLEGTVTRISHCNQWQSVKKKALKQETQKETDISDIKIRILAGLPATPTFIRERFKEEWKRLEKRLGLKKEVKK